MEVKRMRTAGYATGGVHPDRDHGGHRHPRPPAALVVPKLIGRTEEAKKTQSRVQIKSIEQALELFKLDNGFFPGTDQGLEALVRLPEAGRAPKNYRKGGYLDRVPKDPWGNPYVYVSPGSHGDYDISSYGADGVAGGEGEDADINSWETP